MFDFYLNFLHLELNCVRSQRCWSLSMPEMLRLAATIWKCPDFLQDMSGILDTRIPTYCNSGLVCLGDEYPRERCISHKQLLHSEKKGKEKRNKYYVWPPILLTSSRGFRKWAKKKEDKPNILNSHMTVMRLWMTNWLLTNEKERRRHRKEEIKHKSRNKEGLNWWKRNTNEQESSY